jgi:Fe-S-cluster containining protein
LNIPTIQEFKDIYLTKKKIHKLRTFSSNTFEIEGEAFILKKNELNLCPFYSEIDQQASCKIYKFRPIVCRLFPFTWETSEYNPTPVKMAIDFSQNGWDGCPGINHQNGKYWDDLRDEVTGAVLLSIIQSNELITNGYLNQVPK